MRVLVFAARVGARVRVYEPAQATSSGGDIDGEESESDGRGRERQAVAHHVPEDLSAAEPEVLVVPRNGPGLRAVEAEVPVSPIDRGLPSDGPRLPVAEFGGAYGQAFAATSSPETAAVRTAR